MKAHVEDRLAGSAAEQGASHSVIDEDVYGRISRLQTATEFIVLACEELDGPYRRSGMIGEVASVLGILSDEGRRICSDINQRMDQEFSSRNGGV